MNNSTVASAALAVGDVVWIVYHGVARQGTVRRIFRTDVYLAVPIEGTVCCFLWPAGLVSRTKIVVAVAS